MNKHFIYSALLMVGALNLTACGGGGGGGGGGSGSTPPIGDISGTWSGTQQITSFTCPVSTTDTSIQAVYLSASQTNSSVTVSGTGLTMAGVMDGNILHLSGTAPPQNGGTNTITSTSLTVASDCNAIDGTAKWSWSNGDHAYDCNGTTTIHVTRDNPVGCSTTTPPPGLSGLAGTWFGNMEDMSTNLHTLSITIDSSGNITSTVVDGSSTGTTATIVADASHSQVYDFSYSDGTTGGFIPDSTLQHAAFIDDTGNIGVVQKGATSLPTYTQGMLTGNWSGLSLTLDSSYNITGMHTSTSVVADSSGNLTSGLDIFGSFTGAATLTSTYGNASYGRYYGTYTSSTQGTGGNTYFLTPDGQFAASYAWGSSFVWPSGVAFSVLSKH